MKKFIAVLLSLVLFLSFTQSASAESSGRYRMNEVSTLERDETIDGNYFTAGEKVEILGVVNGDIYAAGGFVIIDGIVNGDVLAAGGNVIVSGKVNGDIRVAGGEIDIQGPISGSATILGGTIDIDDDATIGKGLVIAAGNVNVDADIKGDIDASVGNMRVSDDASVSGTITKHDPPAKRAKFNFDTAAAVRSTKAAIGFASLISTLIIGLLALKFFPRLMLQGAKIVQNKPLQSGLCGLLGIILIPILIIILLITLIGIPFAIALTFFFAAYLFLSNIYVILWAGGWIMEKMNQKKNSYLSFLIGAIAYYIVTLIPIIGGLVCLTATLVGFGAILINKKQNYLLGREKEIY